jgi:hypothetical protein
MALESDLLHGHVAGEGAQSVHIWLRVHERLQLITQKASHMNTISRACRLQLLPHRQWNNEHACSTECLTDCAQAYAAASTLDQRPAWMSCAHSRTLGKKAKRRTQSFLEPSAARVCSIFREPCSFLTSSWE